MSIADSNTFDTLNQYILSRPLQVYIPCLVDNLVALLFIVVYNCLNQFEIYICLHMSTPLIFVYGVNATPRKKTSHHYGVIAYTSTPVTPPHTHFKQGFSVKFEI